MLLLQEGIFDIEVCEFVVGKNHQLGGWFIHMKTLMVGVDELVPPDIEKPKNCVDVSETALMSPEDNVLR